MSKDKKSSQNRSVKIGQDAAGSVIISGDGNVATIAGGKEVSGGRQSRDVPKVFISSTSDDLKTYREAARDAGIGAGFLPVQMEYFVASGQHAPLEACLHKVAEVDLVVLIVAYRYMPGRWFCPCDFSLRRSSGCVAGVESSSPQFS